jgi:hypothetical protein
LILFLRQNSTEAINAPGLREPGMGIEGKRPEFLLTQSEVFQLVHKSNLNPYIPITEAAQ